MSNKASCESILDPDVLKQTIIIHLRKKGKIALFKKQWDLREIIDSNEMTH
jgi:hypothetical protein